MHNNTAPTNKATKWNLRRKLLITAVLFVCASTQSGSVWAISYVSLMDECPVPSTEGMDAGECSELEAEKDLVKGVLKCAETFQSKVKKEHRLKFNKIEKADKTIQAAYRKALPKLRGPLRDYKYYREQYLKKRGKWEIWEKLRQRVIVLKDWYGRASKRVKSAREEAGILTDAYETCLEEANNKEDDNAVVQPEAAIQPNELEEEEQNSPEQALFSEKARLFMRKKISHQQYENLLIMNRDVQWLNDEAALNGFAALNQYIENPLRGITDEELQGLRNLIGERRDRNPGWGPALDAILAQTHAVASEMQQATGDALRKLGGSPEECTPGSDGVVDCGVTDLRENHPRQQ